MNVESFVHQQQQNVFNSARQWKNAGVDSENLLLSPAMTMSTLASDNVPGLPLDP